MIRINLLGYEGEKEQSGSGFGMPSMQLVGNQLWIAAAFVGVILLIGGGWRYQATSNQVIATTTEVSSATVITLRIGGASTEDTTLTGTLPVQTSIHASVSDRRSGSVITGVPVRFTIVSDTSASAYLANESAAFTDTGGVSVNQVTMVLPGTVIVIAELLDFVSGDVTARSNEIIINGE